MEECVTRHSSWLGGVTVELFQKDLETEKLFLQIFQPDGAIQMPSIGIRIGELIDERHDWWTSDEPDGPATLANAVVEQGLPWFDEVRTLEQQAEDWYGRSTALMARGYHGPSLVGLALTLYLMGEIGEACEVLRKPVPKTAIQANVRRVARVREWLGCDATEGPRPN